jgi:hypothetical protein
MRMRTLLLLAIVLALPVAARAQTAPAGAAKAPLRVFVDCWECDTEYLRQHVTFVDYVRDRMAADLHILVTTQSTGGGGMSWTVKFIGLGRFASIDRSHIFSTRSTATSDDRRREFARVFQLGLAAYAADTAVASDLDITYRAPSAAAPTAVAVKDTWRRWVFRVNGSGSTSGEKATKSYRYSLGSSANRVTEDFKVSLSVNRNQSESRFTLSDGRRVVSPSDSWSVNSTAVKSLGPKLSAGARVNASHSSFSNSDRAISILPGIEYDFFPYADYQRRSLTVWYEFGPSFYRYREPTIYDKLRETTFRHQVDVSLSMRQPWGSLYSSTSFSQNLQHRDRYNLSIYGSTDVRLFKGFSFNLYGSYSRIKDQTGLARAEATPEEILLRIRQLATNYRYSYSFGISYNFGSIYTSIVNPRFNGQQIFFFF